MTVFKKSTALTLFFAVIAMLLSAALGGCAKDGDLYGLMSTPEPPFASFREIPGITAEEIGAIEALQSQRVGQPFVYGMLKSTEAFIAQNGEIRGFAAHVADYLSELFGIRFEPTLFDWDELLEGLESGEIDFTGELTPTEERRRTYIMTSGIAERIVYYFRPANAAPLEEIAKTRALRYGFLRSSSTADAVLATVRDSVTPVFINTYREIYGMLTSGKIDAFFDESVAKAVLHEYSDVIDRIFLPLIYEPVAISTRKPELAPIIAVIQKALKYDAMVRYVSHLYSRGENEYTTNRLYTKLTPEEREYIRSQPTVNFGAEFDNYPLSFYNTYDGKWQGIAHDVLREIERLTGITFKIPHGKRTDFADLFAMLEKGELSLIGELIRSPKRENRFLWSQTPLLRDRYVLISKTSLRGVNINDILYLRVGVQRGTVYADLFRSWFPTHAKLTEFGCVNELFLSLERDRVDVIMASQHILLSIINYMEHPGYKANMFFNYTFESSFGFNKDEHILHSVIDKALQHIDVERIADAWMHKTYDYRSKIARARSIWFVVIFILLLCLITLLLILTGIRRSEGKRLAGLVQKRTKDLELLKLDLENALDSATTANRAKSVFLANISHEIRTPLNAIIGMADIAMRSELSPETRWQMTTIRQSGTSLLSIIDDILDISNIESGKLEVTPEPYSPHRVIDDVIGIIRAKLMDSPVKFVGSVDASVPQTLCGDELRIRQILLNVLGNAVKYTDAGTVSLSVDCETVDEGGINLIFKVADTGKGIKKEDTNRLFESFVQINLVNNKGLEGTGLGLAITWHLIKAMGGDIFVDSEVGKGSVFTIILPQSRSNQERSETKKTAIFFTTPNARVLLVDDIETNLKVAEGLLSPYKIQIDKCRSGADAIEAVSKVSYDIVLMDHMMPEMDGIEATRHIRALPSGRGQKLPIIALTANAASGMKEMFLQNGFDDFLSKPIDTTALNALIEEWIPEEKCVKHTREEAEALADDVDDDSAAVDIVIKGVNVKRGINTMGGKVDNYLQTLGIFHKDGQEKIGELQKALDRDNLPLYTIYVHAIKSAAANIGATRLTETARGLETAARNGNRAFIDKHNSSLIAELGAVLTGIDSCLKAVSARTQRGEVDISAMKAELLKLKNAIDDMDVSAINEAGKELKQYTVDEMAGTVIDNILQNTLIGEYDEAVAQINKILPLL
jgi:signal transduction histidine kinase/CheY-like chemotaxis protein